jgi:hypothetical protein
VGEKPLVEYEGIEAVLEVTRQEESERATKVEAFDGGEVE